MPKYLAVFDFDHTLVDDNSDTAMISLIDKKNIPQEIKDLHCREGWTSFMQGIFQFLFEKGITQQNITNLITNLTPVSGMIPLIKELHKMGSYDIIIISDSNSCFINMWLQKHSLDKIVMKVFTNPSEFKDGMLKISMYHVQDTCKLSTVNLCKGRILEEFLTEQQQKGVTYERIMYIGDGVNDFCPALRLSAKDLVCARNNYKLMELVSKAKEGKSFEKSGVAHIVKAEVLVWDNGDDILQKIKN